MSRHTDSHHRSPTAHQIAVFSRTVSKALTLGVGNPDECAARVTSLSNAVNEIALTTNDQRGFGNLIDAANLAGFRMDDGDFVEADLVVRGTKEALNSLAETYKTHGRYIAHSHELNLLNAFVAHYATMMRNSTQLEWDTARGKLHKAYRKMEAKGEL